MSTILILLSGMVAVAGIAWFYLRGSRADCDAPCPACGKQSLRYRQWILATVIINGKRAPDSWCYLLCESCGARYKQHRGRDFEIPSDEEWNRHCSAGGRNNVAGS